MEKTQRGLRRHVAIFGEVNAGKSTLFNLLTQTQTAIVSDIAGTTTDPVSKSIELLPFGPIVLIDTAGTGDTTDLGKQRMAKTKSVGARADLSIIVIDGSTYDPATANNHTQTIASQEILYVISKADLTCGSTISTLKETYPTAIFVAKDDPTSLQRLQDAIVSRLNQIEEKDDDLSIGKLLPYGSTVLMVIPIDSAAPKGRLIQPQVQLLRECLDNGIKTYVVRDKELEQALTDIKQIDLVICDSQVFAYVNSVIPSTMPLTSFSMFLAYQKGNLHSQIIAVEHIQHLQTGNNILMLEACTHSTTHEDIGKIKIPTLLKKHTGKDLNFHHFRVHDMPQDLSPYHFVIMCGGCMINRKEVQQRLDLMKASNLPATNYGVVLAYLTGILERCKTTFEEVM